MCSFGEVDIVSSVFMSRSMVFKVDLNFDVLWKIILLSSVNSPGLVEFSDECYCRQSVTGICPMFQGCSGKACLMLRPIEP